MLDRWLKGYKYSNTRNYLRLPAPWPIRCRPLSGGSEKTQVTSVSDVSAGGVSLTVNEPLPVGSRLHVEIHVPPLNRSLHAEGSVVRCASTRTGNRFELGIRFDRIDPLERIALNDAVERFYSPRDLAHQHGRIWRRRLP